MHRVIRKQQFQLAFKWTVRFQLNAALSQQALFEDRFPLGLDARPLAESRLFLTN